jgi:secreted PhoX family phosphatase
VAPVLRPNFASANCFFSMKKILVLSTWLLLAGALFTSLGAQAQTTVRALVSADTDDMEEYLNTGIHDIASSDLELVQESTADPTSLQIVGLRFRKVDIPPGAIIQSARIQFTYDNTKTLDPCVLFIKAERGVNPATFTDNLNFELARRPKLADSVQWTVPSWAGGATGTRSAAQLTSDISALVQQLVNQQGWVSGNPMAFYLTGRGTREAESYEGAVGHSQPGYAPELIVTYVTVVTTSSLVNSDTDDMEEYVNTGIHDIASSDLELVQESTSDATSQQIVGLRFKDIKVPKNAVIQNAYIQFTYDNTKTLDPCVLTFKVENSANPATFTDNLNFELARRPKLADSVRWTVPSWAGGATGTRGAAQRSTNLAALVQRLVNRADWNSGNPMAFYITGQGTREAESYEGAVGHSQPGYAPELVIQYLGSGNPVAPVGEFPMKSGAVWSYYAEAAAPPANWAATAFDDAAWKFGPAQFGYGDGDEATVLPFGADANNKWPVYYFRHKFVYNPNQFGVDSLIFLLKRDDGAVVYLNGTEIFRDNMPTGTAGHTTLAASAIEGAAENAFIRIAVPARSLVNGQNVLAASVHQNAANSSDLSFDLSITEKKPPLATAAYPVSKESTWAFWDKGTVDANWNQLNYNDSGWDYGQGALGYGDPMNTTVGFGPDANNKFITTWFRKRITIANLAALPDTVQFNLRRDDGAIVYVNGVEVLRSNMPAGAVTDNTFASSAIDGANETTYFGFKLPKTVFVQGLNVIAARVHQRDGTSSDLGFDLETAIPSVIPPVASGCNGPNDTHIGCFTSVSPLGNRPTDLILPSTHRFQKIIEQGDNYTKTVPGVPFTNIPGNNDFTAFVSRNGSNTEGYITINHETAPGGVTIVDARYNATTKLWVYDTIQPVNFYDGDLVSTNRNCSGGITPWGTILTCEETFVTGDANNDGYMDLGWIVEIDPVTKQVKQYGNNKKEKLWAMGRMSHENAAPHPDARRVYYAEDGGTSCVYKFIADEPRNLYKGELYVLRLDAPLLNGQPNGTTGTWVRVPNTTQSDRNNTNAIAASLGGTAFNGPEDVEYHPIDDMVYFTSKGNNCVYRFKDNGTTVANFSIFVGRANYVINYGTGNATEPWGSGNDNLTVDDRGNLWVMQDGSNDHMWMVRPGHTQARPDVLLFARTPAGSEPCGFHMTPDFRFGFLSIQAPNPTNNVTTQIDAAGNRLAFDRSTSVVVARRELLGTVVSTTDVAGPVLDMTIAPNPSDGNFKVSFHLEQKSEFEGVIADVNGRVIQHFSNTLPEGDHVIDLSMEAFGIPSGVYFLVARAGEYRATKRIVVQR